MQNQVIYIIIFQVCAVISMYKTYDWKEKVMIKNILKHWFWMSWLSYWKPSLTVLLVLFKAKKTKLLRCYITYLTILFGNFTSSWDLLISLCLSNTTTEVYTPITKSCSDAAGISPSFFLFPLCIPGSLSLLACICLSRRGAKFLPVRPVKQHSWNSSTQQGSAVFKTRHVSSFDAKLFSLPMWYKVVVV